MGLILAPLSLIIFLLVFIIEFIFSMLFKVTNKKWFKLVSIRMYKKAKLIDIFGNFLYPEFWNFIFSVKGGYTFGVLGETISSVLGKKKLDNTLNIFGLILYYILYTIDIPSWKHGGHCIRYIMSDEDINNFSQKYGVHK